MASKIQQSRAWDHCLLCGFTVEEEDTKGTTGFLKRTNGILKHEAFKSARTTYSMMHPSHYSSDDSDFSDASSDLDMTSLQQKRQRTEDRSKATARHIAVHLQVLMLLTLRFAALKKDDHDLVDDDLKSDYVDMDDEESSPKGNDPENLSGSDFRRDVTIEDTGDEDGSAVAKEMDNDLVEDNIPVPDTDLDLDDIPRQYKCSVVENDGFLSKMIESGAWQSWQNETEKLIRHDPNIERIYTTNPQQVPARAFPDEVPGERNSLSPDGLERPTRRWLSGIGLNFEGSYVDSVISRRQREALTDSAASTPSVASDPQSPAITPTDEPTSSRMARFASRFSLNKLLGRSAR
ncbi:hypothetical protein ACHAPX_001977 [Trichoderma viride]